MERKKVGGSRRSSAPEPQYREALVSYVDIMGFKDLLDGTNAGPGGIRRTVLDVQEHLLHDDQDPDKESGQQIDIAFSDTVLSARFLPGPNDYRPGILFHELYHLHLAQVELLNRGILIRGGLSLGGVYIDSDRDVWFGPGIVSAYQLEANADFPRIVLDPRLAQAFRENRALRAEHHDFQEEADYVRRLVKRDIDGLAYIDPMSTDPGLFDDGHEGMLGWYGSVREHLVTAAARHARNARVLRKYAWLANRFEAAVLLLPEDARTDLSLNELDFPGLRTFV